MGTIVHYHHSALSLQCTITGVHYHHSALSPQCTITAVHYHHIALSLQCTITTMHYHHNAITLSRSPYRYRLDYLCPDAISTTKQFDIDLFLGPLLKVKI